MESQNIWCVLVMLGDRYAPGAAVVARTLRNLQTRYPIWCMVTSDVSARAKEFLATQFDKLVSVPIICHDCIRMRSHKQANIYGSWISRSFTKWNILNPNLFPVNKIILVDADMMFLKNCDQLFDLPAPAMTFSSPWVQPYVAKGPVSNYGELTHGSLVPAAKIQQSFRADGIVGLACMVLVHPDQRSFDQMKKVLFSKNEYGYRGCISGFDEQLIAETFLKLNIPMYHIHQEYNWIVGKKKWWAGQPYTQQYYNGKPWDNVNTPADRVIIEKNQWDDVREWWAVADQIMSLHPTSEFIFYPQMK